MDGGRVASGLLGGLVGGAAVAWLLTRRRRDYGPVSEQRKTQLREIVSAVKEKRPLVHCLTNLVSMDIIANGVLAAGASPVMIHSLDEIDRCVAFCQKTSGVVSINLGTIDSTRMASCKCAVEACVKHGVPWVLDPVAAGFSPLRTDFAIELLKLGGCAVLRGNGSEITSISGASGDGKGVDSTRSSFAALDAACALSRMYSCVVCVSGSVDYVCDPSGKTLECEHGVKMLTNITAAGCLLSAIVAAFVAAKPEKYSNAEAALYACMFFGISSELASHNSQGPASLRYHLLDELHLFSI